MKKTIVLTVAFAAALTSFAAQAMDRPVIPRTPLFPSKKESPERAAPKKQMVMKTRSAVAFAVKPLLAPRKPAPARKVAANGPYHAVIARYAAKYGVPVSLAHAVIRVESNYRPKALGSAGEVGLMQIKPATARSLGYSGSIKGLYDIETNLRYGMQYLATAQQLGGGTTCGTILKYNAGHGARRMNPVSRAYCGKAKGFMAG